MSMPLPNNIAVPFPIAFKQVPSFAYYKGRDRWVPDMIVIHIAEGMRDSVWNTFRNPGQPKSSHFLTNQDGSIWQFVGTGDTAYGNGVVVAPSSPLVVHRLTLPDSNPNLYTISIEHEGFSTEDINDSQYESTAKLVAFLSKKWNILLDSEHVIGHHEIEKTKTCPGLISVGKIISMAIHINNQEGGDN